MLKSVFHVCLLVAVAALASAAKKEDPTPQERFDKLAARSTFGEPEVAELRSIMEAVKEEDCIGCASCAVVCPDGVISVYKVKL